MELILIVCCGTKAPGGSPDYRPPEHLASTLGERNFQSLMDARRELAQMRKLESGLDLGFGEQAAGLSFQPAYLRYTGRVYQRSGLGQLLPKANYQVLIISALYGLIEAGDLIRDYDLAMKCMLPQGKVQTWWKLHHLGDILSEYIWNTAPVIIHDLLSKDYREALKPWPRDFLQILYKRYEYPGLGIGSLSRRGDDLKAILEDC